MFSDFGKSILSDSARNFPQCLLRVETYRRQGAVSLAIARARNAGMHALLINNFSQLEISINEIQK